MKGFRTMAIGLGYVIVGAAMAIYGGPALTQLGVGLIIGGASMSGLRLVTNTPLGESK